MNWKLTDATFDIDNITSNGNRFLIGNGYLGIRGTLEEYEKEFFPAINLAGIYDQVGDGWREPLNAPNALYTKIVVDGIEYQLPKTSPKNHEFSLDYRHGILTRMTTWKNEDGEIRVDTRRFASMKEKHLVVLDYSILTDYDCEITIYTGIDADVWDIYGPHYDNVEFHKDFNRMNSNVQIHAIAQTHENMDFVIVNEDISIHVDGIQVDIADKTSNLEIETQVRIESQPRIDLQARTESQATIEVIEIERKCLRKITIKAKAGKSINLTKYISVYTSKDCSDFIEMGISTVETAKKLGYAYLEEEHTKEWEALWKISEVSIEGDDDACEALNYSLYHLHCIAPRHSESLSIAARGLSGQTYKGAVFWDTEMFMLDFFLYTEPEVAKTLLRYRIDTLDGAKKKAAAYGYEGAFYAWESQEGGYDACSDYNVIDVFTNRPMRTYFKDKQVHISSAVVYGIRSYLNYTKDYSILTEGGAETIIECAKFYYSLLVKKVGGEYYEIHDVIGPDEYHERVNNNAYTNRMAKLTLDTAVEVIEHIKENNHEAYESLSQQYEIAKLLLMFQDASEKLYIPTPDKDTNVIEQFDGYFGLEDASLEEVRSRLLHDKEYWGGAYGVASHTQVIKQADIVTLLALFEEEYTKQVMQDNLNYYEPKTEHGSSLSACMYALLYCKCNQPEKAYPFFMKSAMADWNGKGKEWAGLVYIGGTHPAAAGGAYMTAVKGFGGLRIEDGVVKALPKLPEHWTRLKYRVLYQGSVYEIDATKEKVAITRIYEATAKEHV